MARAISQFIWLTKKIHFHFFASFFLQVWDWPTELANCYYLNDDVTIGRNKGLVLFPISLLQNCQLHVQTQSNAEIFRWKFRAIEINLREKPRTLLKMTRTCSIVYPTKKLVLYYIIDFSIYVCMYGCVEFSFCESTPSM